MRIAVRFEGGLGDHILSNRFIPGILDKHEGATIDLFSSTNGDPTQSSVLLNLFDYYNQTILTGQETESYEVISQFGRENCPQHFDNIKKDQLEAIKCYDKFYNLHIDALDWMNYDFDWQRYFYSFPCPGRHIPASQYAGEDYLVLHLASDNLRNSHRMSQSYISSLVKLLAEDFQIYVLSTPSTREFIDSVIEEKQGVDILEITLEEVISLIKDCSGLFGIDSGVKYLGYTFNKPTLCWARESSRPHSVTFAHQIRWLTFPQLFFPLEFDEQYMKSCMINLINTGNFFLGPHIDSSKINASLLKREYK